MALGAVKVPMLPILKPVQQHQKPPVFPIPLVGITGEGPEDRPTHQAIGQQDQRQLYDRNGHKHTHQAKDHSDAQYPHIQFVRSVPAGHKFSNSVAKFSCHFNDHLIVRILLL